MGIYVKFWHFFYNARSPNMAMLRDPRSKFRKTIFFQILHLILGQVTKVLVEKRSTSVVISQKPHGGGGGGGGPVFLGLNKGVAALFIC